MHNLNVLVTGGASGIGFAIAKAFASENANVHVCDISEERVTELNSPDSPIHAHAADAGSEEDVNEVFDSVVAQCGDRLDVLVNNAGIAGPNGPLESLDAEEWNETLRVNLVSAFLWSRKAVPVMKRQGSGSIVNLSSTAGLYGFPLRTPYAAAKWGVIGLTKSLAMEVGSYGIRVNAICPGSVDGPRMDHVIDDEAKTRGLSPQVIREQFQRQASLKKFVQAEDIAQMVLFICSEKGASISGQALAVDGHTETLAHFEE